MVVHRRKLIALAVIGMLVTPPWGLGGLWKPRQAAAATPPRSDISRNLPDSILARIADNRTVTVGEFQRAWSQVQPPARPASLTPQTAREFLDLLIGKEILAERALRSVRSWTAFESAQYRGFRDQLTLKAAFDSAMQEVRLARAAAGDSALDNIVLGIAARESAATRMRIRYDDAVVARMARAWAELPRPTEDQDLAKRLQSMGALPKVAPADTGRILAESEHGPFRVAELLASWKRMSPLTRPRVETPEQIRDLVENAFFERALRQSAERRQLDRLPDIARRLEERREYFAVTHLVEEEVYAHLPRPARMGPAPPEHRARDSLTLRNWYERHIDEYKLPPRALVTQLLLPDRVSAGRMAARLRDEAEAESIRAGGQRAGLSFHGEVTEESDSALYRAAVRAGAGAVMGPDSVADGWHVARVEKVLDPRRRSFEEARELVQHHHYGVEGERLMQELIGRLRKETTVTLNPSAIAKLAAPGPSRSSSVPRPAGTRAANR
jgi:hypothetical protein